MRIFQFKERFMSFSGANGGATPGVSETNKGRAFAGNKIGPVDHLMPTGHGQWKLRGRRLKQPEDAAVIRAMSDR